MLFAREKSLKGEIIEIGKKLYALRLAVAHSGNLSARLDQSNIFITATGASLGSLTFDDIIKVDLFSFALPHEIGGRASENNSAKQHRIIPLDLRSRITSSEDTANKRLTTEFPLHSSIYQKFPQNKVVIHCHPSLTNSYFALYSDLKALTFESKLYLGNIPVVEQDTPAITKPELVVEALKNNNLAVIKNHGVVSIGGNFKEALYLIEILEEAVKTLAVARLFKKEILDDLDKGLKEDLRQDATYLMFSQEHIQAIVDLVNQDEFIHKKGEELDLTVKLAIKMDGLNQVYPALSNKEEYGKEKGGVYKFNFEKGKIIKLESDEDAPFVISAPLEVWEAVFLGKVDPFVATMQGRMKLKGELSKLSRWYVPFSRLFELFKQIKIK